MKCHFLSEREKIIAVQRLQNNHTGIQTRKFKITQVVDAVRDPSVYSSIQVSQREFLHLLPLTKLINIDLEPTSLPHLVILGYIQSAC